MILRIISSESTSIRCLLFVNSLLSYIRHRFIVCVFSRRRRRLFIRCHLVVVNIELSLSLSRRCLVVFVITSSSSRRRRLHVLVY